MMDYLNNCILLGKYESITTTNNTSCLTIILSNEDGDITIPITIESEIANKLINKCDIGSLIGIKGKIDVDEHGLIIIAEKITFMSYK